jgi:hypothetical protein
MARHFKNEIFLIEYINKTKIISNPVEIQQYYVNSLKSIHFKRLLMINAKNIG